MLDSGGVLTAARSFVVRHGLVVYNIRDRETEMDGESRKKGVR